MALVITHKSFVLDLVFLIWKILKWQSLARHAISVPHRWVYEYNNSAASWSVGPE